MEIIVKRHCVGRDTDSGLSPLQKELLDNPTPVRIAEAPTGAGKSYAFERAMVRGERVLFIVPTRRLAQNLVAGLSGSLIHNHGWTEETARKKLALWTSDSTQQLRAQGLVNIGAQRIREIYDLDPTRESGEMIVAVPETVSGILLRFRRDAGQADAGVFDLLSNFEHIVFDEFHTISSRGFGLAGLIAKLAAEAEGVRSRVSFLSATPLNIRPVLERIEIPANRIVEFHEEITDTGRAVHGDVRLSLQESPRLCDLVLEYLDAVRDEVHSGRQVVVIYDALADLWEQQEVLHEILAGAGIAPGKALLINSVSDSTTGGERSGFFKMGRTHAPEKFDVLIATASLEMGVTFRANLLFMEPGFEPMNFLQRYGRAARGDHPGRVVVRWDGTVAKKKPWLRDFRRWMEENDGRALSIGDLTFLLSRSARRRFDDCSEENAHYFGTLSVQAASVTGLYWKVLMDHWSNRGPRWEHLKTHSPKTARVIAALIREVRTMERDRVCGSAAKTWCDRFEAQVRSLRDIGPRIRVIDASGRQMFVDTLWLRRNTKIMDRFPISYSDTDGIEEVWIEGDLTVLNAGERHYIPSMKTVYFPDTPYPDRIQVNSSFVDDWCRLMKSASRSGSDAWDEYPGAMGAAEKLVRMTGLVVSDDVDVEAITGIL